MKRGAEQRFGQTRLGSNPSFLFLDTVVGHFEIFIGDHMRRQAVGCFDRCADYRQEAQRHIRPLPIHRIATKRHTSRAKKNSQFQSTSTTLDTV